MEKAGLLLAQGRWSKDFRANPKAMERLYAGAYNDWSHKVLLDRLTLFQ
jgi:hypothetical protein